MLGKGLGAGTWTNRVFAPLARGVNGGRAVRTLRENEAMLGRRSRLGGVYASEEEISSRSRGELADLPGVEGLSKTHYHQVAYN